MLKSVKASATIASSEVISQLCGLLRNIILARVLTKEDFGIAATLGMTVSLMEIGGRLSIEQLIVQSEEGDNPRLIAAAHLVQVGLGFLSGGLIFFSATLIARLFGIPEAAWALQSIAVIPVLRSFAHLDIWRMMRDMRFLPNATIEILTQIIITIAVLPLTLVWKSYAVLLWLMIARQLVSTLASHIMAERPYEWGFNRDHLHKIFVFGWPLLLGGLAVFAITQGDRMLIGSWYSVADLGTYAVAVTLTSVPAFALLKIGGQTMLPILSRCKGSAADASAFQARLRLACQLTSLTGALYAIVMIVLGGPLIVLVFGSRYSGAGALAACLAVGQTFRLLRNASTIAAIAKGDTKNLMLSHFLRFLAVLLAIPIAASGKPIHFVAAAMAGGECLALAGSSIRLIRTHRVPVGAFVQPMLGAFACLTISVLIYFVKIPQLSIFWSGSICVGVMLFVCFAYTAYFTDLRQLLKKMLPRQFSGLLFTGRASGAV